ncbi:ankyrin repeat domain-containing protein [Acetobacteraceae bacterium]|nr:ankyrin repeat domain-containing protein [Acetobacteraceae bacterium]
MKKFMLLFSSAVVLIFVCLMIYALKEPANMDQEWGGPMFYAVKNGDVKKVQKLAAKKIGLEERDPADNTTPVIRSAGQGDWDMVEILLKAGADPWAQDEMGYTTGSSAFFNRDKYFPGHDQMLHYRNVKKILLKIGYPVNPTPSPKKIRQLVKEGKWPPEGVKLSAEGMDGNQLKMSDFTEAEQKLIEPHPGEVVYGRDAHGNLIYQKGSYDGKN